MGEDEKRLRETVAAGLKAGSGSGNSELDRVIADAFAAGVAVACDAGSVTRFENLDGSLAVVVLHAPQPRRARKQR